MDILDRFLGHDAWTTRELLRRCEGLSDEQLDREFAIGHGSLRKTFVHIVWNIEVWTDLMCERPVRARLGKEAETIGRLIQRLEAAAVEFALTARLAQEEGWLDDEFADTVETPPVMHTFGATIVHLVTHSMHHRAQVLNMMRQLGIKELIEGDALSWEKGLKNG